MLRNILLIISTLLGNKVCVMCDYLSVFIFLLKIYKQYKLCEPEFMTFGCKNTEKMYIEFEAFIHV